MTTPEENPPRTSATEDVAADAARDGSKHASSGATGRTVREALEEAGVSPEDFEES